MKYCQIVMGPAGSGKSTYCKTIQEHAAMIGRSVHVVNLDPAAEAFEYELAFDVRELISADDVTSELGYGPNGGLVYCMEYLCESMDWLETRLESYGDDDYLLIDCPGQIELYTHVPVMKKIVGLLKSLEWTIGGVYLIDATFVVDASKLLSASLSALSAMFHLEVPHKTILSKCDLVSRDVWERYLELSGEGLIHELDEATPPKFKRLNAALATVLDDYSFVDFLPLDPSDPESIARVLQAVDMDLQYGEDMEPKEPQDLDAETA